MSPSTQMRAAVIDAFGEQPSVREIDAPPFGFNNVLVKLDYAGVNPGDNRVREGQMEGIARAFFPLSVGGEGAGVVESVGLAVKSVKPGDRVYGLFKHDYIGDGTFAEFAPARESEIMPIPPGLEVRDAAAIPAAGTTAMILVEDALHLQRGESVLILGAAGGVGHFAVQLAKAAGARVIAVGRGSNHDLLRQLGADDVIDYQTQDVEEEVHKLVATGVDAAVDSVGGQAQNHLAQLVRPRGRIASCVHPPHTSAFDDADQQFIFDFLEASRDRLVRLDEHVRQGHVRPHIEEEFDLADAAKALANVSSGHNRGKTVLRIRPHLRRRTAIGCRQHDRGTPGNQGVIDAE